MKEILSRVLSFKVLIILITIFYGLLFITNAEPYVRSDGWYYYHTAECIINEHNFVCANQPEYWGFMDGHTQNTFEGKYVSVGAPGTSMLNVPALFIASLFKGDRNPSNDYFMAYNGHTIFDGFAIILNSLIFHLLSFVLIFKSLRLLKFSKRNSLLSTFAVFLSSYAYWYVFLNSIYTHTYEIFSVSLILFALIKILQTNRMRFYILLGSAGGLAVLVRPVLIVVLIASIMVILYKLFKADLNLKLKSYRLLLFVLGGIPFLAAFVAYNYVSYGSLLTSGYGTVREENFGSIFNGHLLLFSTSRGWLVFSPIFILSLVGIIIYIRSRHLQKRILGLVSFASVTLMVIVYGFWPNWWGGGSFGSRFMLAAVPFGVLGLAALLSAAKKRVDFTKIMFIISIILTAYSASLMLLYRVTPLGSDQYTPLYFYKHQIENFMASRNVNGYFGKVYSEVQGGSGLLAMLTGISNSVIYSYEEGSKIHLELVNPPKLGRALPEEFNAIIVNNKTRTAQKAVFKTADNSFTCNETCGDFEIIDLPTTLSVHEYTGIRYPKLGYSIYFENVKNLQFRGERIWWIPDTNKYII